jgi:predicted PurR-regulated permease PerM
MVYLANLHYIGDVRGAISLMVIWGIIALFRHVAEPKVLGSQTGLSPILSLVSIYIGMRLGGVAGMILGPILCLVFLNIYRSGLFEGASADLKLAVRDISALLKSGPKT